MSKLKKNIYYSAVLILSQLLLPLVTFPYVTHILGPEKLGVINFVDSICQNCILIAALGVPVYGIREVAKIKGDRKKLDQLVVELLLIHAVATVIILIPYTILFFYSQALHANMQLYWISVVSIVTQVFLLEWFYQGIEEFKFITVRSLIVRVLSLVALFLLIRKESDYVVYYAILTGTFFLNAVWNVVQSYKKISLNVSKLQLKKHLKPLFYILSSSLAISVYSYMDSTLLGFLSLPLFVGFYTTSLKFVRIPLNLVMATEKVLVPQLANAYHNQDWPQINLLIQKSISFVCLIACPVMCLLYILSPQIISLITGPKFSPAVISTQILSPTVLIIGLNSVLGLQILTTMGRERDFMLSVIIGMVCSVGLNLLLIPKFHHIGTGIANLCTETLVLVLTYYFSVKHTNVSIKLGVTFKYLISAVVATLIAHFAIKYCGFNADYLIICAVGGLTSIIYIIALYFLKEQIVINALASAKASKYLKVFSR